MTTVCLPWHQRIFDGLLRRHAEDRLPHAILLHGTYGCGKRRLAACVRDLLLCNAPTPAGACGSCHSCRLVAHDSHTDCMLLAPEAAGKVLPVADVREACHFLEASARIAPGRVVSIAPAEAMNSSASNALLKTLEEPPRRAHLLLVSSMPSMLLATLRSRCEKIAVPAPSVEAGLRWLSEGGHAASDARDALSLAGGAPLLAQRWLEDGELEQRRAWRSQLHALLARELDPVEVAEGWLPAKTDGPGRLQELLACLQRWAGDELRAAARAGASASLGDRFRLLDSLGRARAALHAGANPNPQLLLEDLLLEWAELAG